MTKPKTFKPQFQSYFFYINGLIGGTSRIDAWWNIWYSRAALSLHGLCDLTSPVRIEMDSLDRPFTYERRLCSRVSDLSLVRRFGTVSPTRQSLGLCLFLFLKMSLFDKLSNVGLFSSLRVLSKAVMGSFLEFLWPILAIPLMLFLSFSGLPSTLIVRW